MKKFFSFIAFAVTFCFCVSCEKEEFSYSDYFVKQGEVLTRSGDDFDPIFELSDNNVPIYIKNVAQGNPFMSEVGTSVLLEDIDDGSARQRWVLALSFGGNVRYVLKPLTQYAFIVPILTDNDQIARPFLSYPSGFLEPFLGMVSFENIKNTSFYYIKTDPSFVLGTRYLQRESKESNNLIFGDSKAPDWAKWEISPLGEYSIEDIEYYFYDGGSLDSSVVVVDSYVMDNRNSSVEVKRTQSVSRKVTESSNFSKTEGISTMNSISSSSKEQVSLPEINITSSSDVSISSSVTKTSSFSQGENIAKERTITTSYEVTVPPYTYYSIKTLLKEYTMNVRYVATLKGADDVSFKVKGIWSGVQAIEMYQEAFDEKNNLVEADIRPIEF